MENLSFKFRVSGFQFLAQNSKLETLKLETNL